ncbi:MAG: diacylglycerol kinase family protein [Bacillota bacterium]
MRGLVQVWVSERNLRIHVVAAWAVLALAQLVRVSRTEFLFLLVVITVVVAAELVNTSVELLTNLVVRDRHPVAGAVKNIAAATVLVAATGAFTAGLVVFWPYLPRLPALVLAGARSRPLVAVAHGAGILGLAAAGMVMPRRRL